MVESAHKRKGTLRFLPPNGQEVTYDLESCQLTEATMDGPAMTQRRLEWVVEFECLPWGRLESVTAWEDRALAGPIDGTEIDASDMDGHVDALATLTLTDSSGESADFVEFGIGQQGYDPDAPLLIDVDDLILGGFAGTQPGGAGTQVEIDLTETPIACCGTGNQPHGGRQKIAAQLRTDDEDVFCRLAYKLDEGAPTYGRWIEIPASGSFCELTLAVIEIGDATRWEAQLEAFSAEDATLFVRDWYIIPAEVCGRIRRPPEPLVGTEYVVKEAFGGLTPGNLDGQTSTVGGLWTAPTDFDVTASGVIERAAAADGIGTSPALQTTSVPSTSPR